MELENIALEKKNSILKYSYKFLHKECYITFQITQTNLFSVVQKKNVEFFWFNKFISVN